MDLPKIKNEDLPEELKELLGDEDAEFEAIVDPMDVIDIQLDPCLLYTSPSPRDATLSRMPSSA